MGGGGTEGKLVDNDNNRIPSPVAKIVDDDRGYVNMLAVHGPSQLSFLRRVVETLPLCAQLLLPLIPRNKTPVERQVGMTPLMLACRLGHGSMVEMLVDVFGTELDPADRVR